MPFISVYRAIAEENAGVEACRAAPTKALAALLMKPAAGQEVAASAETAVSVIAPRAMPPMMTVRKAALNGWRAISVLLICLRVMVPPMVEGLSLAVPQTRRRGFALLAVACSFVRQ